MLISLWAVESRSLVRVVLALCVVLYDARLTTMVRGYSFLAGAIILLALHVVQPGDGVCLIVEWSVID